MKKIVVKNVLVIFVVFFVIFIGMILYRSSVKESHLVKVAILDTGISKEHKAFQNISFKNYDAITKNDTSEVSDKNGHGTAVASTFWILFLNLKVTLSLFMM